MDENEKRRVFQWIKTLSMKTFWQWMNDVHTRAYAKGMNHMKEAMECHPRISKPMVDQVLLKAEEIREEWDGLKTVTINDTEDAQFKTATELIHGLTATEAYIYDLQGEELIIIAGRRFMVRPAGEEAQYGDVNTQP
ncbi:hypothetical protein JJQ72_06515 [Paenibacillus sp. F411]|uniref:hypothetical protein n=1 Tax=Paenibacillus sp. F411 TaxID=2820239 RepID=UPI001AAED6E5|nr:hypothetical protein [Paenibacillus sp. F411]MBO2943631.1 hypothetical protein [Paenibacillus sp. F411]